MVPTNGVLPYLGGQCKGVARGSRIFDWFSRGSSSRKLAALSGMVETVSNSIGIAWELGPWAHEKGNDLRLGFNSSNMGSDFLGDNSNVGLIAMAKRLNSNSNIACVVYVGQLDKAHIMASDL
ncbi:hypothetical protein Salat_2503700 [Sesamum alatum]|uniref:Uncharacterized protein n=1 Tax=Sesamum alatum TaxID=300844 RepID=A0AAE1XRP2_9LAMI|nr:hypothetical protein Salat_2503700 [Sesamum alatum]